MASLIQQLKQLPQSAMVVFLSKKTDEFYLLITRNLLFSINRMVQTFPAADSMEILETHDSFTNKLLLPYYRDKYIGMGKIPLSQPPRNSTFRPKYRFIKGRKVEVYLTDHNNRVTIVVGIFEKVWQAMEFIETCYGAENPLRTLVYATNQATAKHCLSEKMREDTLTEFGL